MHKRTARPAGKIVPYNRPGLYLLSVLDVKMCYNCMCTLRFEFTVLHTLKFPRKAVCIQFILSRTPYRIKITDFIVQRPHSEAEFPSGHQDITHLLWNPKIHWCDQKRPSLDSILIQLIPLLHSISLTSVSILSCHLRIIIPSGLLPSRLHN
jgi:hypothetical protein